MDGPGQESLTHTGRSQQDNRIARGRVVPGLLEDLFHHCREVDNACARQGPHHREG
jgi:hypothetical protein